MKAVVVSGPGRKPQYANFSEPVAKEGEELISVRASALSQLTKSRATGSHYSSDGQFPAVAGTDGVGRTAVGRRVYFVLPEAPFGALAEKSLVKDALMSMKADCTRDRAIRWCWLGGNK